MVKLDRIGLKSERKALTIMFQKRICYVCLEPIPERQGVYHVRPRILTHDGYCDDRVSEQYNEFWRSKRGRHLTPVQLRRVIRGGYWIVESRVRAALARIGVDASW